MKHLEASLHLTDSPYRDARADGHFREESKKRRIEGDPRPGSLNWRHSAKSRLAGPRKARSRERRDPKYKHLMIRVVLVFRISSLPRAPAPGAPPGPASRQLPFANSSLISSILRIFDITVSARSVSAAVAKDS